VVLRTGPDTAYCSQTRIWSLLCNRCPCARWRGEWRVATTYPQNIRLLRATRNAPSFQFVCVIVEQPVTLRNSSPQHRARHAQACGYHLSVCGLYMNFTLRDEGVVCHSPAIVVVMILEKGNVQQHKPKRRLLNALYFMSSASSSIGTTTLSWVSACSTAVEHFQQEGFTECCCQRHVQPQLVYLCQFAKYFP
jgi:hypothetical protein